MNKIQKVNKIFFILILMALFIFGAFVFTSKDFLKISALSTFSGGSGTADSPYVLSTTSDITDLMNEVNNKTAPNGFINTYFSLSNSVDLAGISFTPIGDFTYPFKGKFNGNGYSLIGLEIISTIENSGLFGVIDSDAASIPV